MLIFWGYFHKKNINSPFFRESLKILVAGVGFEPTTFRL